MSLNWHGLPEERFQPYRSWLNYESPGICGTYCCAVLTHDRVKTDTGRDLDRDRLIAGFYQLVDARKPYRGSFIWDIRLGLSVILKNSPYRTRTGLVAEVNLPRLIDQGYGPFIIGLMAPLGSNYGNHWVLAYQYARDEDGQLFFKVYDNHGQYKAVVAAVETLSYAYLKEDKNDKRV